MDSNDDETVDVELPGTCDSEDRKEELTPADSRKAKIWSSYDRVDPKKHSKLTKHHYFLFVRHIYGFALKEKQWSRLNSVPDRFQG